MTLLKLSQFFFETFHFKWVQNATYIKLGNPFFEMSNGYFVFQNVQRVFHILKHRS